MKKNKLFLFSMLLSAVFIGLASKSSPLYPLNDWVDVNCFFTMGRSILDGMVPYRDLYEQKGPVLYFVFAILSVFSRNSYFGVYLLEVFTYGLFLFYSGKLAQLYLGKSRIVYFLLPILAALVATSWSFTHGGSVEQHSLFMLVYGMYSVLRSLKEERGLTVREAFTNGLFAGILLWVKYTMLGFYLGLALFVLIWYLSSKLLCTKLLETIGSFLLGIGAVSAVVFAYFGFHGALGDLFTVYFYNNIFLYPSETDGPRLQVIWECMQTAMNWNINYSWMVLCGFFWLFFQTNNRWKTVLMPILTFVTLALGTYWGGKPFDYYGLVFAAYCIFGLIAVAQLLQSRQLLNAWHQCFPKDRVVAKCAMAILISLMLAQTLCFHPNLYLAKLDKEQTVQYRFAKIINTVENPTLLNYGFLDGGFYYAADATPACRFFCYFNINAPDMWENQKECINNGEADFIVTRYYQLNQYSVDTSKYRLVDTAYHPFDNRTGYTYYLYQKVS